MREKIDFSRGRRGAVLPSAGKTRITIRIDSDVLEWFRRQAHAEGGGSYQTLVNQALREHMTERKQPLEELLRRVIREELKRRRAG